MELYEMRLQHNMGIDSLASFSESLESVKTHDTGNMNKTLGSFGQRTFNLSEYIGRNNPRFASGSHTKSNTETVNWIFKEPSQQ
jgi:hypothetical protein